MRPGGSVVGEAGTASTLSSGRENCPERILLAVGAYWADKQGPTDHDEVSENCASCEKSVEDKEVIICDRCNKVWHFNCLEAINADLDG